MQPTAILLAVVMVIIIGIAGFLIWKTLSDKKNSIPVLLQTVYKPPPVYHNLPTTTTIPAISNPLPSITNTPSTTNALPTTNTATSNLPPAVQTNAGKTGVWLRNPGAGYATGLSAADSVSYCGKNSAILAPKDLVKEAGDKGLQFCASGWHRDNDYGVSSLYGFENSWNGTGEDGCGALGTRNTLTSATATTKLGTYCYGTIPNSLEVAASALITATNVEKKGVWLRNPGAGYATGLSAADSVKYCNANASVLATKDLVIAAGRGGLNFCASGWHRDAANLFENSWYGTGEDGCGALGTRNTLGRISDSTKLGTYCYGFIPDLPEIAVSVRF